MKRDLERDMGEQPIAQIMAEHKLKAQDLVAASTEHLTHKMIARACKGRRLTPNVKSKICNAMCTVTGKEYGFKDLFNY